MTLVVALRGEGRPTSLMAGMRENGRPRPLSPSMVSVFAPAPKTSQGRKKIADVFPPGSLKQAWRQVVGLGLGLLSLYICISSSLYIPLYPIYYIPYTLDPIYPIPSIHVYSLSLSFFTDGPRQK